MSITLKRLSALFVLCIAPAFNPAFAEQFGHLEGDVRLACEALLCLSSGIRPGQCSPSLSHYFGINRRKLSDTISARLDFLRLCPVADRTEKMQSLVDAISRGAGRCDPETLNRDLGRWMNTPLFGDMRVVGNQRPGYCSVYTSHEYTYFDGTLPRYVGKPEEGGYWVAEKDYERERVRYEEVLAKRKADAERNYYNGGNN
ncbi:TrbM/KikA/MpfK family conjugal transfer protein [Achromobacter sp. 413638]|uniref:TrbM/KikA/MpfK family conjugal transfer protein n=1 Tax=Achromobacter sp. 413638 TaxID=3342385 RepID=UPI00370B0B0E